MCVFFILLLWLTLVAIIKALEHVQRTLCGTHTRCTCCVIIVTIIGNGYCIACVLIHSNSDVHAYRCWTSNVHNLTSVEKLSNGKYTFRQTNASSKDYYFSKKKIVSTSFFHMFPPTIPCCPCISRSLVLPLYPVLELFIKNSPHSANPNIILFFYSQFYAHVEWHTTWIVKHMRYSNARALFSH